MHIYTSLMIIFNLGLIISFLLLSIRELIYYIGHIKSFKKEERFFDLDLFNLFLTLFLLFVLNLIVIVL